MQPLVLAVILCNSCHMLLNGSISIHLLLWLFRIVCSIALLRMSWRSFPLYWTTDIHCVITFHTILCEIICGTITTWLLLTVMHHDYVCSKWFLQINTFLPIHDHSQMALFRPSSCTWLWLEKETSETRLFSPPPWNVQHCTSHSKTSLQPLIDIWRQLQWHIHNKLHLKIYKSDNTILTIAGLAVQPPPKVLVVSKLVFIFISVCETWQ